MQRKDFEKMSEAYYEWEKKTDNKHPSSAFKAGYEVSVNDHSVRIQQLEAMIQGLIDAQKPLLEEWAKLRAR